MLRRSLGSPIRSAAVAVANDMNSPLEASDQFRSLSVMIRLVLLRRTETARASDMAPCNGTAF